MQRKPIPRDCIFESVGGQKESATGDCGDGAAIAPPHQEEAPGIVRWNIDTQKALDDLRRALRIDEQPPPLVSVLERSRRAEDESLTAVSSFSVPRRPPLHRGDPAELFQKAQSLKSSLRDPLLLQSSTSIAEECVRLSQKVSLLTPGYANELCDRIRGTVNDAYRWNATDKEEVCRQVTCTSEQLKEVVDFAQFLNRDVAETVPQLIATASHLRTVTPLIHAAQQRIDHLEWLLTDPQDALNQVHQLRSALTLFDGSLKESEQACKESIESLRVRYEELKKKRASR